MCLPTAFDRPLVPILIQYGLKMEVQGALLQEQTEECVLLRDIIVIVAINNLAMVSLAW